MTFAHFSDIHRKQIIWNRIIEYVNYYKDYIGFILFTGDYVNNNQTQFTDLYNMGIASVKPLYMAVGNHDTYESTDPTVVASQQTTYELMFGPTHPENWGVTFMPGDYSMTFYKDFTVSDASYIRLIVLDNYYNKEAQVTWLTNLLADAKTNGIAVITAMHEVSKPIVTKFDCTFQTLTNYESKGGNASQTPFDAVIADFKNNGGIHIANFVGHEHSDMIGFTESGVLNIAVEAATDWVYWTDGKREAGTRTYDAFNIVAIDTDLHLLKLVRIGDNADYFLRQKNVLCYNYYRNEIIFNQ